MKKRLRDVVMTLKDDNSVFKLLGEKDLEAIAHYFEDAVFPAGSIIFKEGDRPDYIAFIAAGSAEIQKQTEFSGKQIVLGRMSKGSFLGEVALFDEEPRSATAMALEDTELLILRRRALEELSEAHPAIGIKILQGIARVLSIRLRQLTERLVVVF